MLIGIIILLAILVAFFIIRISGLVLQQRNKSVTRDKSCIDLCTIGVNASIAERDQSEENINQGDWVSPSRDSSTRMNYIPIH